MTEVSALVPTDTLGWLAAALMVATFACREPRCMRALAVATNLAFIGYGLTAALPPVLALHLLLLPINLWRWAEQPGAARRNVGTATQGASAVRRLTSMHPVRTGSDDVISPTFNFREANEMAFFDDMGSAVRTYPDSNVTVTIIDFDPADGDALNEGEEATFKVRITNHGALDMNAVTVKVEAEGGATLRRPLAVPAPSGRAAAIVAPTWVAELVSRPIASIPANGGIATTEVFTLKAPPNASSPASVNLLSASLNGWDAGLDFVLKSKSVARAAVDDTHGVVVHPN